MRRLLTAASGAPVWSIVVAAIGALVLLAFGSLRIRTRVARVVLTTKP